MNSYEKQIKDWISSHRVQGAKLLQRLVQEKSIRGHESSAQAIIIEKLRQIGLTLDIWEMSKKELAGHPMYCSDRDDYKGNPNVVGILKGKGDGRSLILNGHIDVVPEGNVEEWEHDPFSGNIMNGKLYGRGATDMKGGTVSLLLAIEAICNCGIQLKGDVIFQSVIEEESGGAGTLSAVLRGYQADGAIIPEPTNMKIFPKQQGSMWFRLTVKGQSAHGGTRYEGVSAIEKSFIVINELQKLEKNRNHNITDPLYEGIPIPIPINIGKIHSGQWPSSVPDLCLIEGRMGVAPNETMEHAEKEMERCLANLGEMDEWFKHHPVTVEWFGGRWQPGDISLDDPLMKALSKSFRTVKGNDPIIEASPWGTDGGILTSAGKTNTIIFGPGTTKVAHDTDEYIILDEMFTAAEILAFTILEWCEVAE